MSVQPIAPHHLGHSFADPHARLSVALVLSVALWSPFGLAAVRGDLDLVAAGLRYLVAFVGCRIAVGGIAHLIASYHTALHADRVPEATALDPVEVELVERHRRRSDHTAA